MSRKVEEIASNLLEKVNECASIAQKLEELDRKISSIKEKEPLDREYAEIAELEFEPSLSELQQERQTMLKKLDDVGKERQQLTQSFFECVKKLTLPLPARPIKSDDSFIFKYREEGKLPSTIRALETTLQLKPLVIEDVTLLEDSVKVKATNEQETKQRVVLAIKTLRSLAEIYLSPQTLDVACEKLEKDRYRLIWEVIVSQGSATLEEIAKRTGKKREVVQVCYDMTRDRLWNGRPPLKRSERGVYELTLVGRAISRRYNNLYGIKRKGVSERSESSILSLNKFSESVVK